MRSNKALAGLGLLGTLALLSLGGCFKVDYEGDVTFRCGGGDELRDVEDLCPSGFQCVDDGFCHSECETDDDCTLDEGFTCEPWIEGRVCMQAWEPPPEDGGVDGPVPVGDGGEPKEDMPQPPKGFVCEAHRFHDGVLPPPMAYDLIALAGGRAALAYVTVDGQLHLKLFDNGWTELKTMLPGGLSRVALAATSAGVRVVFQLASDPSAIMGCTISLGGPLTPPPDCIPDPPIYNDQSTMVSGFDLAVANGRIAMGIALLNSSGMPETVYGELTATGFQPSCPPVTLDGLEVAHMRVSAEGTQGVGSVWLGKDAGGGVLDGFWHATAFPLDPSGACGWQAEDMGNPFPAAAPVALAGDVVHIAAPLDKLVHGAWPRTSPPGGPWPLTPIAASDIPVPESAALAMLEGAPLVAGIGFPAGPDVSPMVFAKINGTWIPLPRPAAAPNMPTEPSSPGQTSQLAVNMDPPVLHVAYDAYIGAMQNGLLTYLCRPQ